MISKRIIDRNKYSSPLPGQDQPGPVGVRNDNGIENGLGMTNYRSNTMAENSIIIIGAGFAGLSAGIYAQMNGYRPRSSRCTTCPAGCAPPGNARATPSTAASTGWWAPRRRAACTATGRKWASPRAGSSSTWMSSCATRAPTGARFILYTDVDRLEKHMLEFSPQDAEPTREFIRGIRLCLAFRPALPSSTRRSKRLRKTLKLGLADGDARASSCRSG